MGFKVTLTGGKKTVAAAGTAEKLVASGKATWVRIQALSANTNPIFVGDSNVDKTTDPQCDLAAGEHVILDAAEAGGFIDLSTIYIDVTTNGEGVNFLYLA